MPKNSYIRILLTFGMSLAFLMVGCVDTSVQPIPSTLDYRSEVKIVNLAPDIASADFSMTTHAGETISFGTIAYGDESAGAYKDMPAGSKELKFNSESLKVNTEVDKKMRLFVVGANATDRDVIKVNQRYIFQSKDNSADSSLYRADTAAIAFANGSTDLAITKIKAVSGDVDTTLAIALGYGNVANHQYLKAGDYTISIISNNMAGDADSVMTSFQANLAAKGRFTAIVYGSKASLQSKVFTDD